MTWETSGDQAETRVVSSVTRVLVIKIQQFKGSLACSDGMLNFSNLWAIISHFQKKTMGYIIIAHGLLSKTAHFFDFKTPSERAHGKISKLTLLDQRNFLKLRPFKDALFNARYIYCMST